MQETSSNYSLDSKLKALYKAGINIPKLIEASSVKEKSWDKFYIKLQLLVWEFEAEDPTNRKVTKHKIELENIFNSSSESVSACDLVCGKLLLLGPGGIGKTTLLYYITNRWSTGELWMDKFKYIFRIRLKILLNPNWDRDYSASDRRSSLLACLVHCSLRMELNAVRRSTRNKQRKINHDNILLSDIEFSEVLEVIQRNNSASEFLLLLDGYNEMESLSRDDDRIDDYEQIMDEIFECKYGIMSSRPNSFKNFESKFERILENKGFGYSEVMKYVDANFEDDVELRGSLKGFLQRNAQIRGVCEIPLNVVLFCLIWNDKTIRDKFQQITEFNIGLLYSEVIFWLGKRFLIKFDTRRKWDADNIGRRNVMDSHIVKFMQEIAYKSFIQYGSFIPNALINANLHGAELNIKEIYEFGLLKAENPYDTQIIDSNAQFIHETFQDFLSAKFMNRELVNSSDKQQQNICKLISEHRNEPKYLLVLKFLVGTLSNTDYSEDLNKEDQAVQKLWDAIACNVDGILEFGEETKVRTLMNLLEQSKRGGSFDKRIQHADTIMTFINNVITSELNKWTEQIIESGYLSPEIVQKLQNAFTQKDPLLQRAGIEVMTSFAHRSEFKSRDSIIELILNLITDANAEQNHFQIQSFGLQKIVHILDQTIEDKRLLVQSLHRIFPFIQSSNLSESTKAVITQICCLHSSLVDEVLNLIENVMQDNEKTDFCKTKCIEILSNISNGELSEKSLEKVVTILTNVLLEFETIYGYARIKLTKTMSTEQPVNIEYKRQTMKSIPNIMLTIPRDKQKLFLDQLFAILRSPIPHNNMKSETVKCLLCIANNATMQTCIEIYQQLVQIFKERQAGNYSLIMLGVFLLDFVQLIRPLEIQVQHQEEFIACLLSQVQDSSTARISRIAIADILIRWVNDLHLDEISARKVLNAIIDGFNEVRILNDEKSELRYLMLLPSLAKLLNSEDQDRVYILLKENLVGSNARSCTFKEDSITYLVNFVTKMKASDPIVNESRELIMAQSQNEDSREYLGTIFQSLPLLIELYQDTQLKFKMGGKLLEIFFEIFSSQKSIASIVSTLLRGVMDLIKCLDNLIYAQKAFEHFKKLLLRKDLVDYERDAVTECITKLIQQLCCGVDLDSPSRNLAIVIATESYQILLDIIPKSREKFHAVTALARTIELIPAVEDRLKLARKALEILKQVIVVDGANSGTWINKFQGQNTGDMAVVAIVDLIKCYGIDGLEAIQFSEFLINLTDTFGFRSDLTMALKETLKFVPLNNSTTLLESSVKEIREAAQLGILAHLREHPTIDHTQLEYLLKILNYGMGTSAEDDEMKFHQHQLVCEVQRLLTLIASSLDKSQSHECISWINQHFHYFFDYRCARIFLSEVYHKLLSQIIRNEGNEQEILSSLIIKCIEYGMTTTIKRQEVPGLDPGYFSYQIVFEDKTYNFKSNSSNIQLDEIIEAALRQENYLSKQYRDYKPLFKNDNPISQSALDIQSCSLVQSTLFVEHKTWLLSVLHLSDHTKHEPSNLFALMEIRDPFGYHEIHKIFYNNDEGKIEIGFYSLHPNQITSVQREMLFGGMEYNNTKPRYFCNSHRLSFEIGKIVMEQFKKQADFEININFKCFLLLVLGKHGEYLSDIVSLVSLEWTEYVQNERTKLLKKDELLRVNSTETRRQSMTIDAIDLLKLQIHNELRTLEKSIVENAVISEQDKVTLQQQLTLVHKQLAEKGSGMEVLLESVKEIINKQKNTTLDIRDLFKLTEDIHQAIQKSAIS